MCSSIIHSTSFFLWCIKFSFFRFLIHQFRFLYFTHGDKKSVCRWFRVCILVKFDRWELYVKRMRVFPTSWIVLTKALSNFLRISKKYLYYIRSTYDKHIFSMQYIWIHVLLLFQIISWFETYFLKQKQKQSLPCTSKSKINYEDIISNVMMKNPVYIPKIQKLFSSSSFHLKVIGNYPVKIPKLSYSSSYRCKTGHG